MFTRNWYKTIAKQIAYNSSYGITFKNLNGEDMELSGDTDTIRLGLNTNTSDVPSLHKIRTSLTSYGGVILGTGTTAPTIDDYALAGELITTLSYSSDVSIVSDADGVTYTGRYTISNTGESEITVGEIGLNAQLYYTSYVSTKYFGLLERTVLDEPVTIPAGGVGQITYTIKMVYPTE